VERCGNGRVDAGEECDDGNAVETDCCSRSCLATPDGRPCGDDGNVCNGDEVCSAGRCGAPVPGARAECLQPYLRAFIGAFEDRSISVIDPAARRVVATAPVGDGPWASVIHPLGDRVYVTNREEGTITVLDAVSGTVRSTIDVGPLPHDVVFDATGLLAYVAVFDEDAVAVVDTVAERVVRSIPVGLGPTGLAFSPGGAFLYVANFGADTISVVDVGRGTVTATVSAGKQPLQMEVDEAHDRLYVTNFDGGDVDVVGLFSNTVLASVRVGDGPFGVAVDGARSRAYVTNAASDSVSVIDTTSNRVIQTVPVAAGPLGIDLDPAGRRAIVASADAHVVSFVDTLAGTVIETVGVGRVPVAFGSFLGAVANDCPREALSCDDGLPSTFDFCLETRGCSYEVLVGPDAVASGLDEIDAILAAAPDGAIPGKLEVRLRRLVAKAQGLIQGLGTTQARKVRPRLRKVDKRVRDVLRQVSRALRRDAIEHAVGLRLLDLGRGTRQAVQRAVKGGRGAASGPLSAASRHAARERIPAPLTALPPGSILR
jgi:YVTN family beta-propeller protein/cysteine-rich repeat protein